MQGSVVLLGGERLRLEMAVVDPALAERQGEAADEAALADIFDAEKQLVLEVLALLGVTLTAAEREAIEENRTGNLLALLSYGEGLEAMDRGDYGAASAAFENAARIDPGFQAALQRLHFLDVEAEVLAIDGEAVDAEGRRLVALVGRGVGREVLRQLADHHFKAHPNLQRRRRHLRTTLKQPLRRIIRPRLRQPIRKPLSRHSTPTSSAGET